MRSPACVGTRPAEVCGLSISPISARSDMMLRMEAGESCTPRREIVRDPTGSPVSR
jgi:hypothetical protein